MKVSYTLVFDRKKVVAEKGVGLVQIEAYLNGGRRYFTTKLYLTPKEWDAKRKICKDAYTAKALRDRISEFETFEVEYRALHRSFKLSDFDFFIHPPKREVSTPKISFTEFYKNQLKSQSHLKGVTLTNQTNTLEKLIAYQRIIEFEDLNYEFLQGFESFLRSTHNLKVNTIEKYHRHVRKYINLAIKCQLFLDANNPYKSFSLRTEETDTVFLLPEERDRLAMLTFEPDIDGKPKVIERVRDMFLYACFTGLRFSDCYNLKSENFVQTDKGLQMKFKAQKTGKIGYSPIYLLFDGKPQTIIKKYWHGIIGKRIFSGLTNGKVNANLKILADMANVHSGLYFKASRDTFGTTLYMLTQNDKLVQKQLQHSKRDQTDKYVHIVEQIQNEGLQKVFKPS